MEHQQQFVEVSHNNSTSLNNSSDRPKSILKTKHSVNVAPETADSKGTVFDRAVGLIFSIADEVEYFLVDNWKMYNKVDKEVTAQEACACTSFWTGRWRRIERPRMIHMNIIECSYKHSDQVTSSQQPRTAQSKPAFV